jgi:putative transcriptional regulator
MKPFLRGLQSFGAILVLFAGVTGAARAVDLSQAVMLVASARLAGSPFEQTVILAAPMPQGGYMGLIVNRPTGVKLESLFPEQASSHNVVDPVYLGGPMLSEAIFAVTRAAPDNNGKVFALMPGLVLAIDGATIDRIIDTTPNDARYFLGLMVWDPDELDDQIRAGAWEVRPADADAVFRANSPGLWKSLSGTMV